MNDHLEFLTGPEVCARYRISGMSLWRWLRDDDLAFPQPVIVRRRRYFRVADLVEFDRRQAEASKQSAA